MPFVALPLLANLADYQEQAAALLEAWKGGEEIRAQVFDLEDARMAVARGYDFLDWKALAAFVSAIERRDPEIYPFECAVDAVVDGDLETLQVLLRKYPDLVYARSGRVTHFDPPVHRATLLHYVAANGTEGYRQRTPANAVLIARALLAHGADVDALASLYGGECTTMSLLVSSSHPARAGVQIALIEELVSYGASVRDLGEGNWVSPVETALVFGFVEAAEALLRHGAPVSLASAAGLGQLDAVRELLPSASARSKHRALALATQLGQVEATRMLLDAGEDPNRFNPDGAHSHTPPIHQAVWAGHLEVVRLLVNRGARLDIRDKIHQSTPLGWAEYGGKDEIARYLKDIE